MGERILVVDDEREIADLIEVYLKNDGYTVYKFYNGMDAIKCIAEKELDLAILDIMLPDMDGYHICQKIREKFFYPVIMLTAKIEDEDYGVDTWCRRLYHKTIQSTGSSGKGQNAVAAIH